MKDKIFIFVVGFLIGAIIMASGLLIYQKVNNKNNAVQKEERMQMMHRPEGQELPEIPNGDKEPPSKPDGNQENCKEPPTKQNGVNNSNKQDTKSSNDSKTTNKE